MENGKEVQPGRWSPRTDVMAELGNLVERLNNVRHPEECALVCAVVRMSLLNMKKEHRDIIRYEHDQGLVIFSPEDLHEFGHFMVAIAYMVGYADGADGQNTSLVKLFELVKEGRFTLDQFLSVFDGTCPPELQGEMEEATLDAIRSEVTATLAEMGVDLDEGQDQPED